MTYKFGLQNSQPESIPSLNLSKTPLQIGRAPKGSSSNHQCPGQFAVGFRAGIYIPIELHSRTTLIIEIREATNHQVIQFVTFLSRSWRSLNPLKGSLNHPKKVTKNCQQFTDSQNSKRFFESHMMPRHNMISLGHCPVHHEHIIHILMQLREFFGEKKNRGESWSERLGPWPRVNPRKSPTMLVV